jgi:hypothetical protein
VGYSNSVRRSTMCSFGNCKIVRKVKALFQSRETTVRTIMDVDHCKRSAIVDSGKVTCSFLAISSIAPMAVNVIVFISGSGVDGLVGQVRHECRRIRVTFSFWMLF